MINIFLTLIGIWYFGFNAYLWVCLIGLVFCLSLSSALKEKTSKSKINLKEPLRKSTLCEEKKKKIIIQLQSCYMEPCFRVHIPCQSELSLIICLVINSIYLYNYPHCVFNTMRVFLQRFAEKLLKQQNMVVNKPFPVCPALHYRTLEVLHNSCSPSTTLWLMHWATCSRLFSAMWLVQSCL